MTGLAAVEPSGRSCALLADGTALIIRPAGPADYPGNVALGEGSACLDAVACRDKYADAARPEPLLNPRSVAVAGAGRRSWPAGRTILLNIRAAGLAGLLPRVPWLADDLPQVAGLDLNPRDRQAGRRRRRRRAHPGGQPSPGRPVLASAAPMTTMPEIIYD